MKSAVAVLCLVVVASAIGGCASRFMTRRPFVMKPCRAKSPDPQHRSLAALLTALEDRRDWQIDAADPNEGYVAARVCEGRRCTTVDFQVFPRGRVEALRADHERLARGWARHLKRAMKTLARDFSKRRCQRGDDVIIKVRSH